VRTHGRTAARTHPHEHIRTHDARTCPRTPCPPPPPARRPGRVGPGGGGRPAVRGLRVRAHAGAAAPSRVLRRLPPPVRRGGRCGEGRPHAAAAGAGRPRARRWCSGGGGRASVAIVALVAWWQCGPDSATAAVLGAWSGQMSGGGGEQQRTIAVWRGWKWRGGRGFRGGGGGVVMLARGTGAWIGLTLSLACAHELCVL
jgi:hypothetical protein